jgi:hypothetical protein
VIDIRAHVTVTPEHAAVAERFDAVCTLENTGAGPVRINLAPLSSPSLALEIIDADGAPVLLPPPPVPPAQPPIETVSAGAHLVADFPAFLPAWTEPGRYRIRCRYVAGPDAIIVSDWASFELHR